MHKLPMRLASSSSTTTTTTATMLVAKVMSGQGAGVAGEAVEVGEVGGTVVLEVVTTYLQVPLGNLIPMIRLT
jgi:hypothetical protein